jgi:uncharacterized protein
MTPQERDVIAGIFDRLKQVAGQPRDPEAEKFIAERLAQQPYAPYAMAQAVYVQEQALANMQAQLQQMQAEVEELKAQPQPAQSGGFLSSLFGGGQPARPAQPEGSMQRPAGMAPRPGMMPGAAGMQAAAPQAAGPWGGAQQRAGGGFLAGALTTAAGVAGGMVLGNVLMNAFQGNSTTAPATDTAQAAPAADTAASDAGAAEMQPASYEDPGMFDDGGGDEWA